MTSLQQKNRGFTIVELLIVIVVIGILAALVITTFTGIQQRARNTERQTDIKAIHGQVEAYYAQNGKYPTLDNINLAAWRSTNMKGLDPEALKDPRDTTPSADVALVSAPADDRYSYAVLASDDTACDNTAKDCAKYVLTTRYEGGSTFTKANLN